ncbi:NUDIX domain-containing protein [Curtobacterium sp. MCSS17_016]|uniref:NUDIX domain-containing protein n=1 Tax=Curtobacterium sp. MCSS17_016 TaxID=2175644 RepID=UPI0011B6268E|nr:NUDIX domain-containing protein [Curtobacterium sp. MCSS17_016]WIE81123.1 NUDIX hydrolase [Curtobacterium sp. MCSS17_016]
MTDRQQPLIAIDVVPVYFDSRTAELVFGTAERQYEPYAGQHALPGVLLGADETLTAAALRALNDKAGIDASKVRHLVQVGAFDGPSRDPRDKAISVAFLAVVEPYASATGWNAWHATPALPFDHGTILDAARETARTRLWADKPFTQALTGDVFSTADASALTAQMTRKKPDAGNLNRSLRGNEHLTQVGTAERMKKTGGGRPANLWKWQ